MKKYFWSTIRCVSRPGRGHIDLCNRTFIRAQKNYSQACTDEMNKWLNLGYDLLPELRTEDLNPKDLKKLNKRAQRIVWKLRPYKGHAEVKLLIAALRNEVKAKSYIGKEEVQKRMNEFTEIVDKLIKELEE
jgi:hypothetical protein